ncbi:MAG: terpene cyclase/mutase family protein [Candidatus Sumerlaeota bacterium]|nr:terpene cyclase/mutase family protein [Candidatus Sumerlaeota bacterium]
MNHPGWKHGASAVAIIGFALVFFRCSSDANPRAADEAWRRGQRIERIDAALALSARWLVARQEADGAWRSQTYGMFREAQPLTPYVMSALYFMDQGGEEARASFRRGAAYLLAQVGAGGALKLGPGGLPFPVFSAASSCRMVALEEKTPAHLQAQRAYLDFLRSYQLTAKLGWTPEDSCYGGWGFSLAPPRKPAPREPRERFHESNLVATIFALATLRSANTPAEDPCWGQALAFVKRCQNFEEQPERRDPRFDDGGFFFMPEDELQNKAGAAGHDRAGRLRFYSYGTMTADGLRSLLQCGLPRDHPRVIAARQWLERHFSAAHNPGHFIPDREILRDATYYYWCWSAAHAFTRLNVTRFAQDGRTTLWAEELADEILRRGRADGTWANRYTDAREDDPLVATAWACSTLILCRRAIAPPDSKMNGTCGRP